MMQNLPIFFVISQNILISEYVMPAISDSLGMTKTFVAYGKSKRFQQFYAGFKLELSFSKIEFDQVHDMWFCDDLIN